MTDRRDDTPPDPHADRLSQARERMSTDYDDGPPPRGKKQKALATLLAGDATTRRLTYGAVGLGALLVLGIGGWSLFGHHQGGIPVLGPPAVPLREKPANPGGMQLDGMIPPAETPGGAAHLAPGPEQPDPAALAARYGEKAKEAAPETASADPGDPNTVAPSPVVAQAASKPAAGPLPSVDQTAPKDAAPKVADAPENAPEDAGKAPDKAPDAAPAKSTSARKIPLKAEASQAPTTEETTVMPVPDSVRARAGIEPKDAPAEAPAAANGPYGIQLAALDSEVNARKEWDRVKATAPDLFAGHAPLIEKVTNKTAVFYRLRMRGFDSVAAAQSFCVKLREHGHACNPLRP